jgi:hypothetical protein
MAATQRIARLGAWEGYEVEAEEEVRRRGQVRCLIRLRPLAGARRQCGGCGHWCEAVHDVVQRRGACRWDIGSRVSKDVEVHNANSHRETLALASAGSQGPHATWSPWN